VGDLVEQQAVIAAEVRPPVVGEHGPAGDPSHATQPWYGIELADAAVSRAFGAGLVVVRVGLDEQHMSGPVDVPGVVGREASVVGDPQHEQSPPTGEIARELGDDLRRKIGKARRL
jgi:hypothetical protein